MMGEYDRILRSLIVSSIIVLSTSSSYAVISENYRGLGAREAGMAETAISTSSGMGDTCTFGTRGF